MPRIEVRVAGSDGSVSSGDRRRSVEAEAVLRCATAEEIGPRRTSEAR